MKPLHMLAFAALFTLGACGGGGAVGEECETDDDCEDGLECHSEHEHDDHDHEGEEEEHAEEEGGGTCEEPEGDEA